MTSRLFLVAPEGLPEPLLLDCSRAACATGDCAVILVPPSTAAPTTTALQNLGLAVLLNGGEARMVHHLKADGLQVANAEEDLPSLRQQLRNESLGILAGVSRHAAMEAAEAGADYVAFNQTRQTGGEPLIGWWQDVTAVPAVAFDPVDPAGLSTLLPQNPDFLRPMDVMWESPEEARRVIAALQAALP
jgi:thiamine-phosphate pyrophosphorylase